MIALRSASAPDTRALGAALARVLRPGDVVVLCGDLGAGKTTLAQGVAAGLGVREQVTSPTFVLVRPYACAAPGTPANPTQVRFLLHADLYRLDHTTEVAELALGEMVEDAAAALVEWGDVAEPVLGATMTVQLADDEADVHGRVVTLQLPDERGERAEELLRRFDQLRVGG